MTNEKFYKTDGPEFGNDLCGKNLMVVKSLYESKSSAARFREDIAESLVCLRFKKVKYDPVL